MQPHYTSNSAPVQAGDLADGQGRIVATLRGDGVLVKCVHGARHMLRPPRAWCVDCCLVAEAERRGAWGLAVVDLDRDRQLFFITLADLRRFGFRVSRGYGEQIGARLERFSDCIGHPQAEACPSTQPQPARGEQQLALW